MAPVTCFLAIGFSRAWHRLHVFLRLGFPALGTGYMFSCDWVFLRLALVTCFLAIGFSRAWHWLNVFPRLASVTSLPALDTGYTWLHVFPRLASVTSLPALGTGYMFSRAWHWLHVFLRLVLVKRFPAFGTCYLFSRAWHPLHAFLRFAATDCYPAVSTGYMPFVLCSDWPIVNSVAEVFGLNVVAYERTTTIVNVSSVLLYPCKSHNDYILLISLIIDTHLAVFLGHL